MDTNPKFLPEYKFKTISEFGRHLFLILSLVLLQIYHVSVLQCIFASPPSVFVQSLQCFVDTF